MKGFTLWFTGLPCSGKSTLAKHVEEILLERGVPVEVLDGDEVRENLSKGLGYSKEDRDINIRRIGWVCKLLSRNGVVAIAAAIAPYQEIRDEVRRWHDRYVEVYLKASIESLKERDVKGMYKQALAGKIKNFTGISDPYEEPENPEVLLETDQETVEESVNKIIRTLELLEYIPTAETETEYSADEEEKIKTRLKDLGYI
ncbi:MAG: adenylyl-sulfate kinase [Candidatus Latescibacterota bacterium]|nr:MAG: adenylyl-sulfate kinase [Candidatus Latescibacterota bacterium]